MSDAGGASGDCEGTSVEGLVFVMMRQMLARL